MTKGVGDLVEVEARPSTVGEDQAAEVKFRGATNAVDSLARGEEVFTVFGFVTSFSFCGGRKCEPSYSQNWN